MHTASRHSPAAAARRRHLAALRCEPLSCGCRDPLQHRCEPRPELPRDLDHIRDAVLLQLKVETSPRPFDWDRDDVRALYQRDLPGDRFVANIIAHRAGWLTPAEDDDTGDQLAA